MLSYFLSLILFLSGSPLSGQAIAEKPVVFETKLIKEYPISLSPVLESKSAIVVNSKTGEVLFEKDKDEVLPIASLTKLMTAIVFLENRNVGWEDWITFKKEDRLEPAWINVEAGGQVEVKDIFDACLVGSANDAAKVLSRLVKEPDKFTELMNEKAKSFGMEKTKFFEPTGLDPRNTSTVFDLSLLIKRALEKKEIEEALKKENIVFKIKRADNFFYWRRLKNTNKLLNGLVNLKAKTGYLEESGYCLAGADGMLTVSILKAPTDEIRFKEAKILLWWAERASQK